MKIPILILLLLFTGSAYSFVENTTKGYANCMACHISPNGGGILTDYGRSLSAELMSTWRVAKGFEQPYYGVASNSKHLLLGGQFRTIQVYAENNQVKLKRRFTMQNNLEFALKYSGALLVGTIGRREGPESDEEKGEFLSERHFLLWEVSPEARLRVGKFRQHFGINHPNHTRFVKNNLGFGSNSETYNFEYSHFFDWGEINTSTSLGKFYEDPNDDDGRRNLALNLTHYLGGNSRLGLSLLREKSDQYKRGIFGANALFPLSKSLSFRSELDFEVKKILQNNSYQETEWGLYGDHQLVWQVYRGIFSYLIFEHAQSNLSENLTQINSPGVGFQFLPIPHFEFQLEYQRRLYKREPSNPEHRGFLAFHLYH